MIPVGVATQGANQLGRVFTPFDAQAVGSSSNHLALESGPQLAIRIDESQGDVRQRLGGKRRLEKAPAEADISQPAN